MRTAPPPAGATGIAASRMHHHVYTKGAYRTCAVHDSAAGALIPMRALFDAVVPWRVYCHGSRLLPSSLLRTPGGQHRGTSTSLRPSRRRIHSTHGQAPLRMCTPSSMPHVPCRLASDMHQARLWLAQEAAWASLEFRSGSWSGFMTHAHASISSQCQSGGMYMERTVRRSCSDRDGLIVQPHKPSPMP